MEEKINEFIGLLGEGDVALFYYAGHAAQVNGENYLIPVDFQATSESTMKYHALPAGEIEDRMERSGAQLRILVLDSCRTNPFLSRDRAGTTGLAAMSPARGTYIAFATAPNSVARITQTVRTACLLSTCFRLSRRPVWDWTMFSILFVRA